MARGWSPLQLNNLQIVVRYPQEIRDFALNMLEKR